MPKDQAVLAALPDPKVRALLTRLHRQADRERPSLYWQFLDQLPRLALGRAIPWDRFGHRLDDKFICLDRSQGVFCYLLARSLGARRIVEFGTSFGVSTIYLALALRENGGGRVIGTGMVPSKAARAREHLREAGLVDFVEIRGGDATETLRDLEAPVDMLLCDGFPPAMLPVLKLVAPKMRAGGVVVSDNVGAFWADHGDFLSWVRDPANGFQSAMLAMNEGTELSVKLPSAASGANVVPMEGTACAS
jgi:predicted O-methyltransferase YrrM